MAEPLPSPSALPALLALQDRVRAAIADRQPLRIQGGGSKAFLRHADVPGVDAAEALDTRGHRGIVAYEPSELVVTVRAGTPLAELEAALSDQGQCLPFEPPHFQVDGAVEGSAATVGGMVAAGLAGPARACVGGVRDYVLGVQLINGLGELVNFGGTVMKNVAGYDVSRLMVGAWGSLGLITQVSLKVLPRPVAEATLRLAMDQATMLRQLNTWMGQPLPLNASSWVDGRADAAGGGDSLYLRLRGARAAVEAASATFQHAHGAQRVDSPQTSADWTAARDLRLPFFTDAPAGQDLWRLSLPPTAPALDVPQPQLIEWMGGLRWLWAAREQGAAIAAQARQAGGGGMVFIAARGQPALFSDLFDLKSTEPATGAHTAIQQRLKAQFDPHGVFASGAPWRLESGL